MSETEFRQLLADAIAGERRALDTLMVECQQRFREMSKRRIGDRLRAHLHSSDVMQEASLEILRRLGDFEGKTEAEFYKWVTLIFESRIKKEARHFNAKKRQHPERTSQQASLLRRYFPRTPTISSQLGHREELEAVQDAVDELPEDYRRVLELIVMDRLPVPEAAAALARSENATRMLLSRARASLALSLERRQVIVPQPKSD